MKLLTFVLPVGCVLVLFGLSGCSFNRVAVKNSGNDVIRVKVDGSDKKYLLGQGGIGYYDLNSKIRIGDSAIQVGKQVEIENKGTDVVRIVYNDSNGGERTMLLGENGTGSLGKSTPFRMGNVSVEVVDMTKLKKNW